MNDSDSKILNEEIDLRKKFEKEIELRKIKKYKKAELFFNELKFNKYGVPLLTQDKIESLAEVFLNIYSANVFSKPQDTPLIKIMNELENHGKLNFDSKSRLESKGNERILGKTIFSKKLVLIDKSLRPNEPQFNFVLGHELGHLFLHTRKKIIDDHKEFINFSEDGVRNFLLYPHKTFSVRNQIEWQANAFSAAILMPRKSFSRGLINIQTKMGVHRNIGIIYLDNSIHNKSVFYKTIEDLSQLFNTSRSATNLRHRPRCRTT